MRVELFTLPVDILSHAETVDRAVAAMRRGERCQHVALNVAKLVRARCEPELDRDIRASDIVGVDGAGIALALRLQGHRHVQRVAGIDLFESLVTVCAAEGLRPFFLGAKPEVVAEAVRRLRVRHVELNVAGYHHGHFGPDREDEICGLIRSSAAHCLFVALPTPAKERFMNRRRDELGVPFIMGVGGSFDVLAGRIRRAPALMQRLGAEWLFRLAQEPRRLGARYLRTNAVFAGLLAADAFHRVGRAILRNQRG